ncbi:MAG: SdrD B-like domain-containing protein, partial [Chitinophagales bacterium]
SIDLVITGTSTYQIIRNGEIVASGFPANPITIDGFNNNDTYDIVIVDENNSLCTQEFSGLFACSAAPSCDLGATVEVVCLDDDSGGYNLIVELTGSGTYFIETFTGAPLEGQTAGTIEVGPLFDEFYNVLIFKENNDICNLSLFGSADCQPDFPPCDVQVQLDINCIGDDEYEVTMFIEGNSTYDIYEGLYVELPENELVIGNVEPGFVTVGPFENGVYDLLIVDQNNPTCYVDFIGSRNCNNPNGCNINAGVTTFCNEDNLSFNVIINLEGTSEYEITVFQELGGPVILNLENQTAGVIEAGPIFGDEYYIFIQDEDRPFCTQDFLGIRSCVSEEIPPCDLVLGATTECQTDGSGFNVILDLTGSGTYTIEDGFGGPLFDVEAGQIVLGPYPNGFFYNIFVQSEDNFTCFGGLNGFADCTDAVICDLTTSAEISCIEGDTYTIDLTIGGTGTFNVNSNLGDLTGVSAGVYTFGPAALNTYDFTVTNAFNAECTQTLSGTENCVDVVLPCDLTLTASAECDDDKTYSISVNVNGSDTYTVYNNGEVVQAGVSAGELQVGPFDSGSAYNIEVVNDNDEDCRESASGIRNCAVTTACDLTATAQTVCLDESRYQIVVNFSGNDGDTYTLNDGVNPPITGQTGGEVILSPIFNGGYSVVITSETDPTCSLTLNGTKDCSQELPCDIEVTDVEVNCTSENGYTVIFEFEGTGTFTLSDNQNTSLTGQTEGTYTFNNFTNGDYAITITSETTPNCSLTFNGSRDCTPGGCDLVAIPTTICTINGNYLVEVELTGSSTYTLDDGVNPPLTNQSSGSILMGPLPQGDYSITITDETDAACNVTLTGSQTCPSLLATVGDIVFHDLNKNGLQDDLQKVVGLQGVKVNLISTVSGELASDVSDVNGNYGFEDVPAGDYFVEFEIPEGFAVSPQDVGSDDTFDSDINAGGITPIFTVAEGATLTGIDAGMYDEGECAGFEATSVESCPDGNLSTFYQLLISIEGGVAPYTIDAGPYYFNDQIMDEDFPLLPIGEIPTGDTYTLVITDANGCQVGPITRGVNCVKVPIELLTFNGEVQKDGNALQWITASETNNDYFTLLRSEDGINFESIAKVDGNGTSSETHVYDFLDRNAPNGKSYYRLNQTDFDGTQTASNVISLVRGENENTFDIVRVYPIPTKDVLQVQFNTSENGSVNLQLFDIVGRELLVQSLTAKSGLNNYSVDVSG